MRMHKHTILYYRHIHTFLWRVITVYTHTHTHNYIPGCNTCMCILSYRHWRSIHQNHFFTTVKVPLEHKKCFKHDPHLHTQNQKFSSFTINTCQGYAFCTKLKDKSTLNNLHANLISNNQYITSNDIQDVVSN